MAISHAHKWSMWIKGMTEDTAKLDFRVCKKCMKSQWRDSAKQYETK